MSTLYTYQDYEKYLERGELIQFIGMVVRNHINSPVYRAAKDADEYDHQRDITVRNYAALISAKAGNGFADVTAANNKISSNFFHRLNTQRCTYSLGNGVYFKDKATKARLGDEFDTKMYTLAYYALIHGVCFGFWNLDKLYVFPVTEFLPLWDEETGALRAGIRFWQLADNKPVTAVLYTENGYATYRSRSNGYDFELIEPLTAYIIHGVRTEAGGYEVVGSENYSTLPIIPMWGSRLKQSTLVGMRERIDSFDLIQSGFANDLQDCAQIYWIVENCNGMDDEELKAFLNRLRTAHVATADTQSAGITNSNSLKPYVQDVPYQSRMAYLDHIRKAIYEDFGALDVHAVNARSTNDHLDAAYQPMDENADDFEYQCIIFIQQLLALIGLDDMPIFKRNRIANQYELTQMVIMASAVLSPRAILKKLPFIDVDEVDPILAEIGEETDNRFDDDESGDVL